MSHSYPITDTADRKMEVGVDKGGAVRIVKKWLDEKGEWIIREMIVNGDEWERISQAREKEKGL